MEASAGECFFSYHLVYVLEFEDECWYVGTTTNLNRRIYEHFDGRGAKWCKEHKPVKIHSVNIGHYTTEKTVTLELVKKYGKDKVRGAGFTHGNIKPERHFS